MRNGDKAVYFHYPQMTQDAMRIVYPAGFTVESAPADDKVMFKQSAAYVQRSKQAGNSITVWRDLLYGEIYYPPEQYAELRSFYNDFERKDHGSIVLKRTGDGERRSGWPVNGSRACRVHVRHRAGPAFR